MDDLVRMVAARMDGPVDLVAQSMGGVIAARLAIEQPQNVRRLVLTVTSGGVDMTELGAVRLARRVSQALSRVPLPGSPSRELAGPLPVEKIAAPTLLLWGDADPISPRRRRPASRGAHSRRPPAHRRRAAIMIWHKRMPPRWRR